ncbi:hypothetical protein [Microvirga sp. P5_D2]
MSLRSRVRPPAAGSAIHRADDYDQWAIDPAQKYARTLSRLYGLGEPAPPAPPGGDELLLE